MNLSKKLGIYLHIPFCRSKCAYCTFNSVSGHDNLVAPYVSALTKEIKRRAQEGRQMVVQSIYFGGGTPSLLAIDQLSAILSALVSAFDIADSVEITLEANPEGLDLTYLSRLKGLGFNRLSLGAQSFDESFLSLLGRRHSSSDTVVAFKLAREAGFNNINLDLIIWSANRDDQAFGASLSKAISLEPEHISTYILEVHQRVPLFNLAEFRDPKDDVQAERYGYARTKLIESGLNQYEISNFAKAGFKSIHNMLYWKREDYFGFGAGAHSFSSARRRQNLSEIEAYIEAVSSGQEAVEFFEDLSRGEELTEKIILALRLTDGLDLRELEGELSQSEMGQFMEGVEEMARFDHLRIADGSIKLSPKGMLVSNDILARLILG